ncbi:MAG: Rho termination factor N-terminal domain-containing protein, partial [Clostridia bacterium]|nr:Rho termination factor N-terminal domain-containing protein [Clostridia bacterium]
MSEYEKMTLVELKELAKEMNVKNISKFKKEELIAILTDIKKSGENTKTQKNRYDEEDKETANATVNRTTTNNNTGDLGESVVDYKLTNEEDEIIEGILEVLPDGYGFFRGDNYLSSPKDVNISPIQIRRFRLDTGDIVKGISRCKEGERFPSLIFVGEVNGEHPEKAA